MTLFSVNKTGRLAVLCGAVSVLALTGCKSLNSTEFPNRTIGENTLVEDAVHSKPIKTDAVPGVETGSVRYSQNVPAIMQDVVPGGGAFIRPGTLQQDFARERSGAVELAFDRAPVAQIVNAVIGEILGANFVIDPAVEGEVTLRTAKPVKKADMPLILNEALNLVGVSLIETGSSSFSIVPSAQATRFSRAPELASGARKNLSGNGMVIAPLNYVAAKEMARILQPFTPQGSSIRVDETREILILSGQPKQIDALLDTIEMFDVDWLSEMSFGVYETRYVPPEALIDELDKIYGGAEGPIGSQVEFIAMPRIGSVLVVSKRAHRLAQAEEWIRKLDRNVGGEGRKFQFLSILNADAEAIAETISDLVGEESSNGFGDGSADRNNNSDPLQITGGNAYSSTRNNQLRIRADLATNSLIIFGNDEEYRQISDLVAKLDVLPDQVLIEALVAEVTLNDELRFGVQWFFDTRTGGVLAQGSADPQLQLPGFAYAFSENYVRTAVNALASVTDIEIISSPQIVTLDNQAATLQVGDQVPIVTQTAVSVDNPNAPIVNSVQFRDTGILLTVTPRVNDGNMVILEVAQEISNAVPTSTSGIDAPTIQQRRFDSAVTIADGETLALGGLISTTKTVGDTGVPILKDIPLLGNAFSQKSDSRSRTELVIFLTPHIIRSREDARIASEHIRGRLEKLKASSFSGDQN